MGKHAKPRVSVMHGRTAQRAAAVSAGTFVLCLGAAAPALASTGSPTPPLPIPLPQPVTDTVQQLSDATGLPNPLADTTTTTATTHHRHKTARATSKPTQPASTPPTRTNRPGSSVRHSAAPVAAPTSFTLGGLRSDPATSIAPVTGRAPAMAHQPVVQRIVQEAGSSPLAGIPGEAPHQDTARILLVALATMILGGLTSGHIKAAQQAHLTLVPRAAG